MADCGPESPTLHVLPAKLDSNPGLSGSRDIHCPRSHRLAPGGCKISRLTSTFSPWHSLLASGLLEQRECQQGLLGLRRAPTRGSGESPRNTLDTSVTFCLPSCSSNRKRDGRRVEKTDSRGKGHREPQETQQHDREAAQPAGRRTELARRSSGAAAHPSSHLPGRVRPRNRASSLQQPLAGQRARPGAAPAAQIPQLLRGEGLWG